MDSASFAEEVNRLLRGQTFRTTTTGNQGGRSIPLCEFAFVSAEPKEGQTVLIRWRAIEGYDTTVEMTLAYEMCAQIINDKLDIKTFVITLMKQAADHDIRDTEYRNNLTRLSEKRAASLRRELLGRD